MRGLGLLWPGGTPPVLAPADAVVVQRTTDVLEALDALMAALDLRAGGLVWSDDFIALQGAVVAATRLRRRAGGS